MSESARVSAQRPFYARHAGAYDLLITDSVRPWVDAVDGRLGRGSRVLDAGCGTGRHAAALIAAGHRVDLADGSAALLELASRRCPGARALLVDLCAVDFAGGYDAVTCRGVLNDMVTDAERDAAIAGLVSALRPGGTLFLDVREAQASRLRAGGETRVVVGGPVRFSSRTVWRDGLLAVGERYELIVDGRVAEESTYAFTMRPWTRAELWAALRRHGLRRVEITGGVGRRTTDRLFVVGS